jgi:hypothetical protein
MGDFELPYAASAIKATPLWTDTPAPPSIWLSFREGNHRSGF